MGCQVPAAALRSTASSTRWTWSPSANEGSGCSPSADRGHQVDHLVGEAVLVAEAVAGRPPLPDVRVPGLGDQDPAEAGGLGRLVGVVELQDVHVLEVEGQAARASR